MKNTSAICDTDSKIDGYLTTKLPANSGFKPKSCKNGFPNVFVICKTTPNNIENKKKIAIFGFLNNTNASKPNKLTQPCLPFSSQLE